MSTLRTKLTTTDDDEDRMSFISKGSISKGKDQMKKKDKMKLRRERWLESKFASNVHLCTSLLPCKLTSKSASTSLLPCNILSKSASKISPFHVYSLVNVLLYLYFYVTS